MAWRFQNKSHISSKRIDHCLTAIAASRARSNSSGTNRYNKPRLAALPRADSWGAPELARFAGKTLPSHTPKILFIWSLLHSHTGHMPVQRRGEAVGNLWADPSCPLDWLLRFRNDVGWESLSWAITQREQTILWELSTYCGNMEWLWVSRCKLPMER